MTGSVDFRFDAGPQLGGGHAMRCLGLANALRERGVSTTYAVKQSTLDTLPALARDKNEILVLEPSEGLESISMNGRAKADWLVVDRPDGELGETDCAGNMRQVSDGLAEISDSPNKHHDCDVLIDTTAGREAREYSGLVPGECKILTGPAYALLRPSFAALRRRSIKMKKEFRARPKILIGFGATDPHSTTMTALDAVEQAAPGAEVDIILGSSAPCLDEIRTRAAASRLAVSLHVDTTEVAHLMAQADFAIGAAGITSWERCCLGLPTIIITQADNQLPNAASLKRSGAAEVLGASDAVSVGEIVESINRMLTDMKYRHRMVEAAAVMCDGLGARRVARVLFPEHARDKVPVTLRPATLDDLDILFDWQSHPDTRRYFRTQEAPSRRTHENWLSAKLVDPDCVLGIVEYGGIPAGVLRFDFVEEAGLSHPCDRDPDIEMYEVSILVAPDRWRLGIGAAALRLGRELLPFATFRAAVAAENVASQRLFTESGFHLDGSEYLLHGKPAVEPAAAF